MYRLREHRLIEEKLARRRENSIRVGAPTRYPAAPVIVGQTAEKKCARGTTIVAVAFKDGVVVAGDRLTTWGDGEVYARDSMKLTAVENNAVIATCGLVSLGQMVTKDLIDYCDHIAEKNKRQVSLEGKCNLLGEIIRSNIYDPFYWIFGISFGAILAGYDRHSGKTIFSLEEDGAFHRHEDFFAHGSGLRDARSFLHDHFQLNINRWEALTLAIGSIRSAGEYVRSVSHPDGDPTPTAMIVTAKGVVEISRKDIEDQCAGLRKEEDRYYHARDKGRKGVKKGDRR